MNDLTILLGEFLAALPTYILNGILVTLYWLGDSAPALLSIGCAAVIMRFVDREIETQRCSARRVKGGK